MESFGNYFATGFKMAKIDFQISHFEKVICKQSLVLINFTYNTIKFLKNLNILTYFDHKNCKASSRYVFSGIAVSELVVGSGE